MASRGGWDRRESVAADEVSLEFRICNWLGPLPPSSQDRTLGLGHLAGRTSPPPPAPDRPNTKYTNTRVHKYTIHKYTGVRSPGQTSSPAPHRPNTQIHKYANTQILWGYVTWLARLLLLLWQQTDQIPNTHTQILHASSWNFFWSKYKIRRLMAL